VSDIEIKDPIDFSIQVFDFRVTEMSTGEFECFLGKEQVFGIGRVEEDLTLRSEKRPV